MRAVGLMMLISKMLSLYLHTPCTVRYSSARHAATRETRPRPCRDSPRDGCGETRDAARRPRRRRPARTTERSESSIALVVFLLTFPVVLSFVAQLALRAF